MEFEIEKKNSQALLYRSTFVVLAIGVMLAVLVGMVFSKGGIKYFFYIHYPYVVASGLYFALAISSFLYEDYDRIKIIFYWITIGCLCFGFIFSPIFAVIHWPVTLLVALSLLTPTLKEFLLVSSPVVLIYIVGNYYYCYVSHSSRYCPHGNISASDLDMAVGLVTGWVFVMLVTYGREKLFRSLAAKIFEKTSNGKQAKKEVFDKELEHISQKILGVTKDRQLYMDPNMNLSRLSRILSIPTYRVSQALNLGLKVSFFEFLSQQRIEEVKKRLRDPQFDHLTIIDIAYSVGFNSKSSFNSAFKKATGFTPSEFRKNKFD